MPRSPYLRLCTVLAGSGQTDLRRQIQFLKAENEVLRARVEGPVRVTARERYRLVRLAKTFGAAVRDLVTIVKLNTLMKWIRASDTKRKPKRSTRKSGVQTECLDRFIVMGTGHLDHLVGEYLEHYNTERPHSGIGHRTPMAGGKPLRLCGGNGAVRCRARLGGVLRSYYRAAG